MGKLVESWSIFALNESVDLEFLIDHGFYLLHGLQDEEPGLYVKYVAQAVCDVEKCLADQYIALCDLHLIFSIC